MPVLNCPNLGFLAMLFFTLADTVISFSGLSSTNFIGVCRFPAMMGKQQRHPQSGNQWVSCAEQQRPRRLILRDMLLAGGSLILNRPIYASADEGPEAICTNILGCPIPGGSLRPPKKIYKDILEEERDLARQAAERAEKERLERLQSEILIVRAQFAVVKRGLGEMRADINASISEIEISPDNDTAWDNLRRFSRLYDTALRKDGMDLALNNIRKLKIQFDIKAAEAGASALTEALKGLDRAGKKRDVELSKVKFSEAVQAIESWLEFEGQLNASKS